MKHLLPFLFLCLIASTTWSQKVFLPGYVVTTQNDTLQGLIHYQDWEISPTSVTFKADSAAQPRTFTPGDLACFYVKPVNELYVSRQLSLLYLSDTPYEREPLQSPRDLTQEHLFIQKILGSSQVSLYKVMAQRDKRERFFVEKQGQLTELTNYSYTLDQEGKFYTVQVNSYVSQVRTLCNDAGGNFSLTPPDYSQKGLTTYFKRYNECFAAESVLYEAARQKAQLDVGVLGGITPEVIDQGVRQKGSSSSFFGVSLRISLPRASRNRFVRLTYSLAPQVSFQSSTFIDSTYSRRETGKTSLSQIELSYGSYLGQGSIRPFVSGGFRYLVSSQLEGEGAFTFDVGVSYKRKIELEVANLLSLSGGQPVWAPRLLFRGYLNFH